MATIGAPVRRREDFRFLTGRAPTPTTSTAGISVEAMADALGEDEANSSRELDLGQAVISGLKPSVSVPKLTASSSRAALM